jgi:hypothetical protein
MPLPMVPAPTTPTVVMFMKLLRLKGKSSETEV